MGVKFLLMLVRGGRIPVGRKCALCGEMLWHLWDAEWCMKRKEVTPPHLSEMWWCCGVEEEEESASSFHEIIQLKTVNELLPDAALMQRLGLAFFFPTFFCYQSACFFLFFLLFPIFGNFIADEGAWLYFCPVFLKWKIISHWKTVVARRLITPSLC